MIQTIVNARSNAYLLYGFACKHNRCNMKCFREIEKKFLFLHNNRLWLCASFHFNKMSINNEKNAYYRFVNNVRSSWIFWRIWMEREIVWMYMSRCIVCFVCLNERKQNERRVGAAFTCSEWTKKETSSAAAIIINWPSFIKNISLYYVPLCRYRFSALLLENVSLYWRRMTTGYLSFCLYFLSLNDCRKRLLLMQSCWCV